MSVTIANLNALNRELRRMGKEWDQELRDESGEIAGRLARAISGSIYSSGQEGAIRGTLRARRSNRPALSWGGRAKVAGTATASDLVRGVEFGGPSPFPGGGHRFPKPHRGRRGYYVWPAIRSKEREIGDDYLDAIERVWDRACKAVR